MPINKEKYQEAILYLCQQLDGEIKGKKKLAKLLYFADFDYYEKNGQPITGDIYYALPMGPFPTSLEKVIHSMEKNGELKIESVEEFGAEYAPTEIYHCVARHPSVSHLSSEEKLMLDRIAKKYGGLTGKQLEELSHQEAPYVATDIQKKIPYELAYYRGTEFVEV
ncbi:MAG: Panacea domain-containing protein [Candidatus Uhrbacteria bacterium]|nr:Panacea domain-containing protein [Candidatus Uhrbacteria bacterium]MDP3793664.1 Panacea domain-containing protein [Candidatus Uhrbacteria bacterium]